MRDWKQTFETRRPNLRKAVRKSGVGELGAAVFFSFAKLFVHARFVMMNENETVAIFLKLYLIWFHRSNHIDLILRSQRLRAQCMAQPLAPNKT